MKDFHADFILNLSSFCPLSHSSFIVPFEGKTVEFVVGANLRVLLISCYGHSVQASIIKVLAEVDSAHRENRINDGKVDPNAV